ncbi:sugar phosphate isomerase/epimerase [Paenibacillus rhizovicinus]|uniref:Sugar phosphate isomerase/epimerase n=1 Tax=Paenibacillus rhizovicinus TaxID=2704463 RepID=A0A6C0P5G4_9BACL|nr:sugar phosphate isomerase/epimerase [Paenibacillus rhizovicinus]QHW33695.1 sugar phosphate isomerase/epimerase [Paenibacillus rhizovicinus]
MDVKLACMTLPYAAHPFERALEGIARAGYRYVAFGTPHRNASVVDPEDQASVERVRELLTRFGLEPAMLLAHAQMHHTEPVEGALQQIRLAHALGIPEVNALGFWGYHRFPDEPLSAEEYETNSREFAAFFARLAQEAERLGVVVSLKPHTGNTATAKLLRGTVDAIGSPSVKACYDPGNISYYEGLDPLPGFESVVPLLASFIAKDHETGLRRYAFPVPGEGDMPFAAMFRQMAEAGFSGPVVVEKLDGDGTPLPLEELDRRVARARTNLERLLVQASET